MTAILLKIYSLFLAAFVALSGIFGGFSKPEASEIKNVIFFIGDGMGMNSIEKTRAETGEELIFGEFPVQSYSRTASANSPVTDSAAGATALACGIRTNNGCISVYPVDEKGEICVPMNLTELAKSKGMSAGVVTTDSTTGATPACFSSHTSSRKNDSDITKQQLASDLDLIWGKDSSCTTRSEVEASGFTYINNFDSMDDLDSGSRSFGQFMDVLWREDTGSMPTLTQMTVKAIDLLDDNENGFFLMVEGAHIDKHNHKNKGEEMKEAMISFSSAVEAALDYAKKDGHTLVVVTADHETGGIIKVAGKYKYTSTGHTGVNVPLFVYGCDSFVAKGELSIRNIEIPKRIAVLLGEKDFPSTGVK